MAIKNASDLLVYKKSGTSNVAQVTRIIIESGITSAAAQFGLENTYNELGPIEAEQRFSCSKIF